MKYNIGRRDKNLRLVFGSVIIIMGYTYNSWLLGITGLVLILTSIFRWCPLYTALKKTTCKPGDDKKTGCCCDK